MVFLGVCFPHVRAHTHPMSHSFHLYLSFPPGKGMSMRMVPGEFLERTQRGRKNDGGKQREREERRDR